MTNLNVKQNQIDRKTMVLFFCISVFIGALLISNITASKLYDLSVFGFMVTLPVGTSLFALTFLTTDVMSEVWGAKHSAALVVFGFIMRIFSLLFLYFAVSIDGSQFWSNQEAYESILSGSSTILLAGILTYPVSQLADVYIFHYLKDKHKGKNMLWFRNIFSTFLSQLVDSTVFILIAFAASLPTDVIVTMIVGQVLVKWLIATFDTPLVYLIRNFAQSRPLLDFNG